jgi:cold shock CspA family protein
MEVIKIKERKDGSADVTVEMNKIEETMFRELAKKEGKKYSKKFVSDQLLDAIKTSLDKDIKKLNRKKSK